MGPPPIPVAPAPIEAHGYSKHGPGPMASIRFKWTVRLDNGDYYVDETIGENSAPIVNGPMSREAAIQMVDDRESDARRRFEQLKSEMTGRGAAANLARNDSGEFPFRAEATWLDPIATLLFIAGCTERVRLGTAVLIIPYRNPVVQATLDL